MRDALALLALCWIAFAAASAGAHGLLDRSQPAAGATVAASTGQVLLWFTEKIEPAFSAVQVWDASGARVDHADAQGDPSDPTALRVTLGTLTPGTYRVHWKVLTADTHATEGEFRFQVAAH